VYGWRTGAALTTRDGVFCLKYEYGHDRVNGDYNTVGGFVNIGFQLENVLNGESPFTLPEPVFSSPRNLRRMLTQKVKREWHEPAAIVQSRTSVVGGGAGCDEFLASLTVLGSGGVYGVNDTPFPPFPHTSLDPTKSIVVEFDYQFDTAPIGGSAFWEPAVINAGFTAFNFFAGSVPTGQSGHLSITLNGAGLNQSNFTSTNADPSQVVFLNIIAGGTNSLAITNVCIHFNQ